MVLIMIAETLLSDCNALEKISQIFDRAYFAESFLRKNLVEGDQRRMAARIRLGPSRPQA